MHSEGELEAWLRNFLGVHGAAAGTVHVREGDVLGLRAAVNIPPKVQELTRLIPRGKGMAGLAWERDRAVATCNLKADESGDVRPGAKAVDAQAAIAIPVHADGGEIRAVVGIAFAEERDFSEEDLSRFEQAAATLP